MKPRYATDGLNSLAYRVLGRRLHPLYTELAVALNRSADSIKLELEADKRPEKRVVKHPRSSVIRPKLLRI